MKKRDKEVKKKCKQMAKHMRQLADNIEEHGEQLEVDITVLRTYPVTAEQLMQKENSLRNGYVVEVPSTNRVSILWKGSQI